MMKIAYLSDVHVNFGEFQDFPEADILVIDGDVAEFPRILEDYKKKIGDRYGFYDTNFMRCFTFFEQAAALYQKVFYVLGNHEHYGFNIKHTANTLRKILPSKIVILENESFDFPEFRIVGGTLWTDFDKANPISMIHSQNGMSDFKEIDFGDKTFTPTHALSLHYQSLGEFGKMIEGTDKPVIVVSHHAPSYQSISDIYKGSGLNGAYASDLSEFILDKPNIKFWIHGHIHEPVNYMIGECNVVSNPRGYHGYEKSQYSKEKIIEI